MVLDYIDSFGKFLKFFVQNNFLPLLRLYGKFSLRLIGSAMFSATFNLVTGV